ncbi:protein LZIC-like isoform X3 [Varroa jacobsoni]|uniref:protein LZIC-like isoform X3 n=2 Tax=Varroa jacobsoni TaxID=62625 RepID=UPI000BF27933|nr:protein LZIC-like isoform X3 [Varroa jacobsoni]XP_022699323.1 protein LZIC-like isoform X3 [Varroa jacobsoni]XP_022699324.1 protein LZIC-like isoform X3 [Varroa jacobsoni]XP_022699325.1 protein LZIC-like isoform X3 [Varroa jacobsoni]
MCSNMSRGTAETSQLKAKLEEQLDRLVDQLADLEQERHELSEDEYQETKQDTLDQLKEFKESFDKILKGDMTLVDSFNGVQLAIQAAISNAFQTPEIIRLFAKKQPQQLRLRLSELERDMKILRSSPEMHTRQKLEILMALRKLGEELSSEEAAFVEKHSNSDMRQFEKVSEDVTISEQKLLQMASNN